MCLLSASRETLPCTEPWLLRLNQNYSCIENTTVLTLKCHFQEERIGCWLWGQLDNGIWRQQSTKIRRKWRV